MEQLPVSIAYTCFACEETWETDPEAGNGHLRQLLHCSKE